MTRYILIIVQFFILGVTCSCSSLFYYPTNYFYSDPLKDFGIKYNEFEIPSKGGNKLYGWHLIGSKKKLYQKDLYLVFHGNAENMTSHYRGIAWIPKQGDDVLLFDYRGYGRSDGRPNHKGVISDTEAFLDYGVNLYKKTGYRRLIVIGQSIGGAVTMKALENFKHRDVIDLLVLDSTFSSFNAIAVDMAKRSYITYWLTPFVYLFFSDSYSPCKTSCSFPFPTIVLHDKYDPVVPYKFVKQIFNKIQTDKYLWTVKHKAHISGLNSPIIQQRLIFTFWDNQKQ